MSLLWSGIRREAMPWWNGERTFDHEGDDEYPLRDPEEPLKERGQRYAHQVAKAHGVPHEDAERAIKHVLGDVSQGVHSTGPIHYGFASQDDQATHYPMRQIHKLMDPKTWEGKPIQDIPLHEVHATQNFLRPHSVAHNLFHPGQKQPWEDHAVGDPDYHPDENRDDSDESEYDDPQQEKLHSLPRFVHNQYGEIELADGHHRVAADMLLGKTHTRGVMIHHSELE